jgi:DeoR family transcriptional regulator of aga operon
MADSSKFIKSGFYKVCDIDQIDLVITDSGISKESRELLESRGVKYIIV